MAENSDVIPVLGHLPTFTAFFNNFRAGEFVERKFEDSQEFAEEAREKALTMLRDLSNETFSGLGSVNHNFESYYSPPEMPDITVPDPPRMIDIPSFQGEIPSVDVEVPEAPELFIDLNVGSADILERLRDEFYNGLESPEGYSPEVEQGIYDRARSRREADLRDKKDQAYNEFAKRGFSGPPGALQELLFRYDIEDHREETDLNRDIIKQQADLVRQKWEFLIQIGQNLNQYLLEKARFQAGTKMDKVRLQFQFALDVLSSKLRKAETQSTILQSEVQIYAEQARLESLKFDAYSSQIQGVQSKAELERIKAQIFTTIRQSENETNRLMLEQDRINQENSIRKQEHQRSIAESAANLAAQLASAAMTAVNTTASLSGSESDSRGATYSASVGRTDNVSFRYSGSAGETV